MERRHFIRSAAPLAAATPLLSTGTGTAQDAPVPEDPVKRLTANLNPVIQKAREAALAVLQPSAKDLQRGLELHADALVFDAYGFSPRSAVDGEAIKAAVMAGASDVELDDLREDLSMTRCVTSEAELAEYLEGWRASGVTCIFQNAGQECQDPMRLLK
ncbi:MAG: dipeptidase, partial [Verrucomicrobia bacterium]|nr:dipeptidase [Verrucomicrobiota bacterium]